MVNENKAWFGIVRQSNHHNPVMPGASYRQDAVPLGIEIPACDNNARSQYNQINTIFKPDFICCTTKNTKSTKKNNESPPRLGSLFWVCFHFHATHEKAS